jgi:hypothetical protein
MKSTILLETHGYGYFRATNCVVMEYESAVQPMLCSASTARLFRLGPGSKKIKAVFTKRKPRNAKKFYELEKDGRRFGPGVRLKNYKGSFMGGVRPVLKEMFDNDYRYVRVERIV